MVGGGGGDGPVDPPTAGFVFAVAYAIFAHLSDLEVRKFRLVSKTCAAAGGMILSRRNGANKQAYLKFENEQDAKSKIARLDKLLSGTASPRCLLPNYGAMVITTSCMRYVHPDVPSVSRKAIIGAQQQPHTFLEAMRWTPTLHVNDFSANLQPLKVTTLVLQICHPRYLAVVIASSPSLRNLTFLAPNTGTRTDADVLADWENFQDVVNELGGMNQIESLALQDWDLIPNVGMENLRTVKLFVRGMSNVPQSQRITYTPVYPQVTTVQIYLRLPRDNVRENVAIHRFMNRFPSTTTVLLHYHDELPVARAERYESLEDALEIYEKMWSNRIKISTKFDHYSSSI
ncbi:uncharacterized protein LOC118436199 [Folsomia candida]|uniref:uncharacterized protein LOC118436199 n=1 Tax=Folsomia candida TaxID=158441 RepID=UPI00160535A0|nr:uncharacterized protein LOC118436199 [Folsomia candida]